MDARPHYVAECVTEIAGGCDTAGAGSRKSRRNPSCSSQEKMPGATGGVDYTNAEKSLNRILGLRFDSIKHGIERAIEKRLYKCVGRVIAAGSLARVAFGFVTFGETHPVSAV